MARLGIIERRDPAEVTVVVRHRCPGFAFGSALGPYELTSWWWSTSGLRDGVSLLLLPGTEPRAAAAISAAVAHELSGFTDYRRHLDETQELPE